MHRLPPTGELQRLPAADAAEVQAGVQSSIVLSSKATKTASAGQHSSPQACDHRGGLCIGAAAEAAQLSAAAGAGQAITPFLRCCNGHLQHPLEYLGMHVLGHAYALICTQLRCTSTCCRIWRRMNLGMHSQVQHPTLATDAHLTGLACMSRATVKTD